MEVSTDSYAYRHDGFKEIQEDLDLLDSQMAEEKGGNVDYHYCSSEGESPTGTEWYIGRDGGSTELPAIFFLGKENLPPILISYCPKCGQKLK